MPRKGLGEFRAVVGLNLFNGKRQGLLQAVHEILRAVNGVMVINPHHPKSGAIINCRELVIPFAGKPQTIKKFDVYLDSISRNGLAVGLRIPLPIFFVFEPV